MGKIVCIRQEAGPLVKECRYIRPHFYLDDTETVRTEKNKILKNAGCKCFKRSPVDRLELLLALFGWRASFYTLTFSDGCLPGNFRGVQAMWKAFLKSMKRWRKGPFDYVYCIEGKHGDHRYHIHLVLRDEDFSPAEVRFLWPGGFVDDVPLIMGEDDSFRRIAKYMCKERRDGISLPVGSRMWVASRSLYQSLPKQRRWISDTDAISIPVDAAWAEEETVRNPYGLYHYAAYIDSSTRPAHLNRARACACTRATLT